MISPEIKLGSLSLSYNILAFLPVVFYYLTKQRSIVIPNLLMLPIFFGLQSIISTLFSFLDSGLAPNLIALFGVFRFVVSLILLSDIQRMEKHTFHKAFFYVTLINFILSIVQITVPSSVPFFYDLYWKPSMTPLQTSLDLGRFTRAVGTFATPTVLGAYSLISFSIFYFEMRDNKFSYFNIVGVVMSVICGLLALSKIFIIGLPILLLIALFVNLLNLKKCLHINMRFWGLIILIAFLGYIIIGELEEAEIPIKWYLNYILHPLEAFDTRYNSEVGGNLVDLKIVIENNLFIGVGEVMNNNVFVGDSSFFVILYSVGIIGFSFLALYWGIILWLNLRVLKLSSSHFYVLLSLLLIFTGANVFASPLGILASVYAFIPLKDKIKSVIINFDKVRLV